MTVATIPSFICLQDHYNVDRAYYVNGLNQLTTAGALSLTYDNRGNLTSDGTNSYTYDIENRLITGPSGVTLSYDPYGRLAKTTGSATTRMGYDGQDLIAEYNASGTLLRRYVHGDGSDDPILWYEGTGTTDKRYMHKDERGSVIALTNGSGGMVGINAYDDYGIPASTNIGRFQYTGQQYLSDLGLYHYKARIYSPTLGRFLQTDPIGYGDGMNLYAYVGGDPVNGMDPSGTSRLDWIGGSKMWSDYGFSSDGYSYGGHGGTGGNGSGGSDGFDGILVTANRPIGTISNFFSGFNINRGRFLNINRGRFLGVSNPEIVVTAGKPQKIECADLLSRASRGSLGGRVRAIKEKTFNTGLEHGLYGGFDSEGVLWVTRVYTGKADTMGYGAWIDARKALRAKGAIPSFLWHSHPSGNLVLSGGDKSQIYNKDLTVVASDVNGGVICQAPN